MRCFTRRGLFCGSWTRPLQEIVDAAVRRAYLLDTNPLRASVVRDPLDLRKNTGDNTPAMIHVELVAGDKVDVTVSAKGGGSEAKARFAMLNPSDDEQNRHLYKVFFVATHVFIALGVGCGLALLGAAMATRSRAILTGMAIFLALLATVQLVMTKPACLAPIARN